MRKYTECFGSPGEVIAELAEAAGQKATHGYQTVHRFFARRPKESLASQRRGHDTTDTINTEADRLIQEIQKELQNLHQNIQNFHEDSSAKLAYLTRATTAQRVFFICIDTLKNNKPLSELTQAYSETETKKLLSEYHCNQSKKSFLNIGQLFAKTQQPCALKTASDLVDETISLCQQLEKKGHCSPTH